MSNWLQIETRSTEPVPVTGGQLVPFAQSVQLRFPGKSGGLIWNRPVSVLYQTPDGQESLLPVRDVTRSIVWSLAGAVILTWILTVVLRRLR